MLLNIEKHHRKVCVEEEMRGAAAPRTPRFEEGNNALYRAATKATDFQPQCKHVLQHFWCVATWRFEGSLQTDPSFVHERWGTRGALTPSNITPDKTKQDFGGQQLHCKPRIEHASLGAHQRSIFAYAFYSCKHRPTRLIIPSKVLLAMTSEKGSVLGYPPGEFRHLRGLAGASCLGKRQPQT